VPSRLLKSSPHRERALLLAAVQRGVPVEQYRSVSVVCRLAVRLISEKHTRARSPGALRLVDCSTGLR
jgi:hypothetical protein